MKPQTLHPRPTACSQVKPRTCHQPWATLHRASSPTHSSACNCPKLYSHTYLMDSMLILQGKKEGRVLCRWAHDRKAAVKPLSMHSCSPSREVPKLLSRFGCLWASSKQGTKVLLMKTTTTTKSSFQKIINCPSRKVICGTLHQPSCRSDIKEKIITWSHTLFCHGTFCCSVQKMDGTYWMGSYSIFCFNLIVSCVTACIIYCTLCKLISTERIINFLLDFSTAIEFLLFLHNHAHTRAQQNPTAPLSAAPASGTRRLREDSINSVFPLWSTQSFSASPGTCTSPTNGKQHHWFQLQLQLLKPFGYQTQGGRISPSRVTASSQPPKPSFEQVIQSH